MVDAALKRELKGLIVETLKLEDVKLEEIEDEGPLFGEGLGLDSVDALEIVSAVEYRYKLRFPTDGTARDHFRSVETLAAFVEQARTA